MTSDRERDDDEGTLEFVVPNVRHADDAFIAGKGQTKYFI